MLKMFRRSKHMDTDEQNSWHEVTVTPHPRNSTKSYFLININEAGPWTGSSLVFNHNPAFFSIYPRNSVTSYFLFNINEAGPWTGSALVFNLKPAFL